MILIPEEITQSTEHFAATRIQSFFRGYSTRKYLKVYLLQHNAATVLQAAWYKKNMLQLTASRRGYKTRKLLKHSNHPLLVQLRGSQLDNVIVTLVDRVQQEAQSRHMLEEAVRFMWKEVQTLRGEINSFKQKEEKRASIIIQTHWRAYSARKLFTLIKQHKELT
jgi:hypothetical protein